ncbi:hypothetical protein IHQ56_11105 [Methylobacillus flagellatus]|uniref:hypothetical protein n=1 Tax=Methylobacillus flagellatus TaxID=405 RepID=UPI00285394E1|nr:hypothetical protein [Methylobacillus flagellatus]MDR5172368.1 hypothetical protein [Methylobacillus flagellatus]
MQEFFATYPLLAWSVVSTMIALIVVVALWEKLKWWWLNTWMSFPVIGRINTLSKDLNRDVANSSWFKAEKSLCRDYKKFIRIQNEQDFNDKIEYLTKAGDNGRKAIPMWIWILTVAMVFVEAMGFSYVLAGYTLPGASENLQQTGAYGIAFLISIILVALTHFAGHELYKSGKIAHARREWAEDGRKHKLTTGTVPLAKPQSIDDDQPRYTQLCNRVGTHPSYKITILTAVFVISVAVFATYVRGQVLEKSLHQEVVGANQAAAVSNADGLDFSNDFVLPEADLAQNQAAVDKALQDETSIDRHGGWATFIVLAFVFVFLQILGVIFGHRWGFAGQNSAAAFADIGHGRYNTYADVREHYQEITDTAQSKLEMLQQKLMDRNAQHGTDGMHTSKSFYDFLELSRQEEARDRESQRQHTQRQAEARQSKPIVADAQELSAAVSLQDALRTLDGLQDKNAKKDFIHGLPAALQQEVLEAIKNAKLAEQEKASRSKLDAELDDLL